MMFHATPVKHLAVFFLRIASKVFLLMADYCVLLVSSLMLVYHPASPDRPYATTFTGEDLRFALLRV